APPHPGDGESGGHPRNPRQRGSAPLYSPLFAGIGLRATGASVSVRWPVGDRPVFPTCCTESDLHSRIAPHSPTTIAFAYLLSHWLTTFVFADDYHVWTPGARS